MSTATAAPPAPAPPPAASARRSRRWLRVAVPFAAVAALVAVTVTAREIQDPDPGDASYLSPVSSTGDGSSRLTELLRASGITVERVTDVKAALASASSGTPVTLFVTTPTMLQPTSLRTALRLPGTTRLVLVMPGTNVLADGDLPVRVAADRWTAAVAPPQCADRVATAAGPAAVDRERYAPYGNSGDAIRSSCYRGAVVDVRATGAAVTLVGATDPFRNDRIAEHGNAALATGLLSGTPRVIWLDLHENEVVEEPSVAPLSPEPSRTAQRPQPPTGTVRPEPTPTFSPEPGPTDETEAEAPDEPNPLWHAFPPTFWAIVVLLIIAALLFAVASARRFGRPVSEPLPVRVRATETVHGRGALYRGARARSTALDVLRTAARQRIVEALGLPPTVRTDDLVTAVVARTGRDPDEIRTLFTVPDRSAVLREHEHEQRIVAVEPVNDRELVDAAVALQQLLHEITGRAPRPHVPHEGDRS